ncbi:hypothetical protein HK102_010323 [Quaeritorhiza haematococci]|nr:hypothetical protein HK102_010323 [Quaeritorhiza haematococci]
MVNSSQVSGNAASGAASGAAGKKQGKKKKFIPLSEYEKSSNSSSSSGWQQSSPASGKFNGAGPDLRAQTPASDRVRGTSNTPDEDVGTKGRSGSIPNRGTAGKDSPSGSAAEGKDEKPTPSSASSVQIEDADDDDPEHLKNCFICTEPISWYAVGECNHRVCHICSLRLRALYKHKACAMCKTPLKNIVYTKDAHKPYSDFALQAMPFSDKKLDILFEDQEIYEDTMILLRFNCPDPNCDVACPNGWGELKRHVKRVHSLTMCDLCTRHKKVFTHEHTLYTNQTLTRHYKQGDPDDPSFKGHPECGFCRMAFYGDDELFEHCREKHEQCFLCQRAGIRNQYYMNYASLEEHFTHEHYPCRHPECLEKKFIVFATDIDLKAHEMETHRSQSGGGGSSRRGVQLELNFSYSGSPSAMRGEVDGSSRRRDGTSGGGRSGRKARGGGRGGGRERERDAEFSGVSSSVSAPVPADAAQADQQTSSRPGSSGQQSASSTAASSADAGGSGSQQQRKIRPPPGFGSALSEPAPSSGSAGVTAGSTMTRSSSGRGSQSTSDDKEAPRRQIKAPPGFGSQLSDFPPPSASNPTKTSTTARPPQRKQPSPPPPPPPSLAGDPELVSRLQKLLASDAGLFAEFKSLASAYRNSVVSADDFLAGFVGLVSQGSGKGNTKIKKDVMKEVGRVWAKLADTVPDATAPSAAAAVSGSGSVSKKEDMLRAWNDYKVRRREDEEAGPDFPTLSGSSWGSSAAASGSGSGASASSPPSARVLVIKSAASRGRVGSSSWAGGSLGTRTGAKGKESIWDRVAMEVLAKQRAEEEEEQNRLSQHSEPAAPSSRNQPQVSQNVQVQQQVQQQQRASFATASTSGRALKNQDFPTLGKSGASSAKGSVSASRRDNNMDFPSLARSGSSGGVGGGAGVWGAPSQTPTGSTEEDDGKKVKASKKGKKVLLKWG